MVCFATPLCPFLDQPANRPPGVTARPGSGRGHVRKIPKQPEDKDQNGGDHGPKWPGGVRGAGGHSWAPLRNVLLTGVSFLQTKSSRPDTSSASSCLLQAGYELRLVVPSAGRIQAGYELRLVVPPAGRSERGRAGKDNDGAGETKSEGAMTKAEASASPRAAKEMRECE